MTHLLDTHVLVRAATTPERLGAAEHLLGGADRRVVPAVSVWELAIRQGLGELEPGSDVRTWIRRAASELVLDHLPVTAEHAAAVEQLPDVHRDPFDRLLTADARLAACGAAVRVIE
ncbi:PIN domain nuclease, a component of toxin-antitoxin system (PIN domain) [Geodermatophilus pulveris]|uniref:PIN domain nuclease, a component of toxin-antitoxin system (PIN domain) n=1 Tax=Geodermatophilus pulveris TaxID=1564159 RepID=A0A239CUE6_9ACTN|nr:type II toxin-antitoxin system VapC family toxin [Geodermatophilus pulveris]SNS23144.1 PIN domain nuclease, a component of toxin-antitoxin system (PIN domain) [Geodermatophilus pulveris]